MRNGYLFIHSLILVFASYISYAQPVYKWAKQLGGTVNITGNTDIGFSIALDKHRNILTAGQFYQGTADFDPGPGIANLTSYGGTDAFVCKLSNAGNFIWARKFGGSNYHVANSVAVDDSGYVYSTGRFQGTGDFDPGASVYNLVSSGAGDIFVSKLDSLGNFVWAKNLGGLIDESGTGLALDNAGNVFITGWLYGTDAYDFDPGSAIQMITTRGNFDSFVCKLNRSGQLEWVKQLGGTDREMGNTVIADQQGNVLSSGFFSRTVDFDPGPAIVNLTTNGNSNVYISKLDGAGNFLWAKQFSGNGSDVCKSIKLDKSGNVLTTGYFSGFTDFDPDTGTYTLASQGGKDVFISKLTPGGNFLWAKRMGAQWNSEGNSIATDNRNNVYTTGSFSKTVDFDPDTSTYNLTVPGNSEDIFVSKLDSNGAFVTAGRMGGITGVVLNRGLGIAADDSSNLYATGQFLSTGDFDPDTGVANLTALGSQDIFVCKFGTINHEEMPIPQAYFLANDSLLCKAGCINFFNSSLNADSSYWQFPGAVPSSSRDRNPQQICYAEPGRYEVTLLVKNATGADTLRKTEYIRFDPDPLSSFSYTIDGLDASFNGNTSSINATGFNWDFGDNQTSTLQNPTHSYQTVGNYLVCFTVYNSIGCSDSSCTLVETGTLTNVLPSGRRDLFSVYPNPFLNRITIACPYPNALHCTYSISDVSGRIVFQTTGFTEQSGQLKLDLGSLNAGLYFLTIETESEVYTKAVVRVNE